MDELVHGAEIFGFYLEDEEFVRQAEAERLDRDLLTVQVARKAIETRFPLANHRQLFGGLLEMLVFDAIVGNNDRHHLNWGVIRDVTGRRPVTFAPIYDTARGLFWNQSDASLAVSWSSETSREAYLNRYIRRSACKMGWDGDNRPTHFELVEHLRDFYPSYISELRERANPERLALLTDVVNNEFKLLMTSARRNLIIECLRRRLKKVASILS